MAWKLLAIICNTVILPLATSAAQLDTGYPHAMAAGQSRTKLHDTNEAANQCYESAQKSYASIVGESKERLNIWKHEYVAIKKILCYLDVWLHDGNSSTVKGDQIEECKKKDFDDATMDLVFPEAPAKLVIDLTPVEKYPGSPGFEQEEYSEFPGVKTITPCMTPTTTPEVVDGASGYTHIPKTCVHSSNLDLHKGKTVAECAAICDANPLCLAFEYGVEYGGKYHYLQAGDCQEQSSTRVTGCDGTAYNTDVYVKDRGTGTA